MSKFVGCGAQYDPVFWTPDRWREDVRLMQETGLSFVRLFEFSWSAFEPEEGRYEFAWADSFIEILVEHEIDFILCTPGATPPRWLTLTYPETAIMDAAGNRNAGEKRRHGCPSSPVFMERLLALSRRLAERYGKHKNLIGWQIDNELGHPACYCPLCQASFQEWLKRRFTTLDDANRTLGMRVWSREYSNWDDIRIPVDASPQLHYAFRRWTSEHWIEYTRRHVEVLRPSGSVPITTNMMAPWHGYDHYEMAEQLDVVGMDHYVYSRTDLDRYGFNNTDLDFCLGYTRAIASGAPFWIMETDGAGSMRKQPSPGRLSEWTWRHIAHGADLVNYFRWDCPPFGPEGSDYGLVGPGSWKDPNLEEMKRLCRRVRELKPMLDGTQPQRADVALLFSYAAWWRWLDDPPCQRLATNAVHAYPFLVRRHCHGLVENGVPFDLVGPEQDWSHYSCVVVPHCPVMDAALVQRCVDYVEAGGRLLLTAMSGSYDEDGVAHDAPYPWSALHDLTGTACGPYGNMVPDGEGVTLPVGDQSLHPEGWVDRFVVEQPDCNVLLAYDKGCYRDAAALTVRQVGEGSALYLGTVLPQDEMPHLYRMLLPYLGVEAAAKLPDGVWMRSRVADDGRVVRFVQNMGDESRTLTVDDVGEVTVSPHETLVLEVGR